MCRKLVYLTLLACVLGSSAAQAAGVDWIRAAYWDSRYTTGWADEVVSAIVRDGLEKAGYQILNADQLKAWMDARIADKKYSVVVFCKDRAPVNVVETRDANCTLRRYLDVGGKIVHYADIPFYNVAFENYSPGQWADAGAPAVLGFNTAGAPRTAQVVTLTPAGTAWGLTQTWSSSRAALPNATTDLEILATGIGGNAAAWVKHYVPGDTFRGFVRIWDFDVTATVRPTIEEIIRVAEYTGPKAMNPVPANGATGVTMPVMQWTAAPDATAHQVYFGTDLAAVSAADTSSPEYKGKQPLAQNAYVSMFVPGTTYYWRIDETLADGTTVSTGEVWSFAAASEAASSPKPADGAAYVALDAVLEWTPGMTAVGHDVYFGTDRAAVAAGAAETKKAATQPATSYTPTGLQLGTTYYWRVDEVGAATVPGQVWSFTVRPVMAKTDASMIGWWKLDDEKAGVAVDSSGWDHHGALMGKPQWVEGRAGEALRFDGIDDYVDCGTDASFNFSGSVTISAWIKTGVLGTDGKIASNQNNTTGGYKLGIYTNKVEFEIRPVANTPAVLNRSVAGGTTLTPGVWYHVVGVYDLGKSIKTYVNGSLDREFATTEVLGASGGNFTIGRESYTGSYYLLGWIDDVRIYNKALTDEEVVQVMQGDALIASSPQPAHAVMADILDAAELSWSAGSTAAKHDVYLGKDRDAVKAADVSAPEYKGQQAGTSYSPAGEVELGGGSYYWRVDEVEADGTTIHKGNVWRLTVPNYLIIDNFESYTNDSPNRVFQAWIDGYGYSADEFFPQENPGNGTGAGVGHDIWTEGNPYYKRTIMETVFTYDNLESTVFYNDNFQSMPLYYDNASADTKYYSEAGRTWTEPQDLTAGGVTDLSLWFKGRPQKFVQNADGSLTLSSTSGDISGTNADYFRFFYKKLEGDGSMIIKVDSLTFTANWTKCGVMIRESLDVASARAHMITLANGRIAFENRPSTGGAAASQYSAIGANTLPIWLKLERKGNDFTGYYSTDGTNWTPNVKGASGGAGAGANPQAITMGSSVLIGVCLTSNNAGYAATLANAGYGGLTAIAQVSNVTTAGGVGGDWTVADIGTATQPNPANDADDLYVALQDKAGKVAVATWPNGAVRSDWTNWVIPLSEFKGVNTSAITKVLIGVGDRNNPQQDGAGMVLIDNVRVIK